MEWLTEQMQEQHRIPIEFDGPTQASPMSEEVRVFLFKATKELLMNIVKHAQAKKAKVSVRRNRNDVRILVEDDGVGFNCNKDYPSSIGNGFGLFNIRERLKYLGGHMEIESKLGHGTWATLVAPLKQKENNKGTGK